MTSLHRLPRLLSRHASLALLLGATAIVATACSAANSDNNEDTGGSGAGTPGGSGAGTPGGSGVGGGFNPTGGSGGSTGSGFEECATSSVEATLAPVNMVIMFDRSESMNENDKWGDATEALKAFLSAPESAGLRVALRFFPDDPGYGECAASFCNMAACAQPEVPVGTLSADPAPMDAQENILISTIDDTDPNGDHTPIYPALGGAVQWARDYLVTAPAEKAVAIFVTDGEPYLCTEDADAIAALAGEGFTNGGIPTYAVGLEGSNEGLMNNIALQGGTNEAIFIGSGGNAQQELLDALKAIQGSQIACSFQMPEAAPGETIDPGKVNVEYTPGNSGNPASIGQVQSEADCSANGGWYYDNPAAPTMINLCPSTCSFVQADIEAKIRVVLGCATTPAH
jgi:hypothetical protein